MVISINTILNKTVRKVIFLTVFFILSFLKAGLNSQISEQNINSAALLQQFVGTRAPSMGEAFTAVSDDIYALHYNPAGLVKLNQELGGMYFKDEERNCKYLLVGYGQSFPGIGTLANSLYFYDAGKIVFEDEEENIQTLDFQKDYLYTLGFARKAAKDFSLGINLKLYSSTMRELYFAESYCLDVGAIYDTPLKGLSVGAVLQNLGSPIQYTEEQYPLPNTARFGATYKLMLNTKRLEGNVFTISADVVKSSDSVFRQNFGVECGIKDMLFFRAGYKMGYDNEDYSFGVGLRWYGFQADYGAIMRDLLAMNPISFSWRKTEKKEKEEEKPDEAKKDDLKSVMNVEKPVARNEQSIVTVEEPPTLERDPRIIKKLSEKFIELCAKGNYSEALKTVIKQKEVDPENISWARMAEKLDKVVKIIPSATEEGKIQELIRKTVNGYLAIKGNERIAIMAAKYALQLQPKNQNLNRLCDLMCLEYPGIAEAEVTKPYVTIVEQKVAAALDYIYEGKYEQAIFECDDALSLEENNVTALKRKGSAYYALGKKDLAISNWNKAERISPYDLEIRSFLEKIK
ncbi:MAG TPA: hypothetical protein DCP53_04045 [Elusimicrobia bacterium]|nr:MAG: hypothetical protein A2551_00475 [Elusimicrobia bacterium RIFOXYD2_FULL_34_30]HAM38551.1 hypothetical protein [Elusimicrobiota bacterium]